MLRRIIIAICISLLLILFIWINSNAKQIIPNVLIEQYLNNSFLDTNAKNMVTSIYLNYRVYDTILESFLILIGIIAIIHFSRHEGGE